MKYETTYANDAKDLGYKSAGQRIRYCHDMLTTMEENQRREERQQRWCFGFLFFGLLVAVAAANYGGM